MRLTTVNDILLTKGVKRTWGFASCSQSTNRETLTNVGELFCWKTYTEG